MNKILLGLISFVLVFFTSLIVPAADVSHAASIVVDGIGQNAELAEGQPEEEVIPYFSYEEAVGLALKNSPDLKNARQDVVRAEEIRQQLSDMRSIGFTPVGPGFNDTDSADRSLLLRFVQADIGWQMASKQAEILEETIAFQVRGAYDEVLKKIGEFKVAELALESTATKLRLAEIKVKHGMESHFNLQNIRNEYHAEKLQEEILNSQLDEAYMKFNQLLGLEQDERRLLKGEFAPDWIGDIDLYTHHRRVLNDNPYLWLQEQKIELAQLEVDLYTYNVGALPYSVKQIDASKEKNNLSSLKQNMETAVNSLYSQLRQLESQHSIMETNLAKAESALNLITVRYDLGMAIAAEIEQAELAIAQLEYQMKNILISYNQLKLLFEKPWIRSAV